MYYVVHEAKNSRITENANVCYYLSNIGNYVAKELIYPAVLYHFKIAPRLPLVQAIKSAEYTRYQRLKYIRSVANRVCYRYAQWYVVGEDVIVPKGLSQIRKNSTRRHQIYTGNI